MSSDLIGQTMSDSTAATWEEAVLRTDAMMIARQFCEILAVRYANNSKTKPAHLLAVFVVDADEKNLVTNDK